MQTDEERLLLLLDRYLAGDATAAGPEHDPEHAPLLEDLRLIRRVAAERPPESSVDAAWARAVEALGLPAARRTRRVVVPLAAPQPPSRRRAGWAALAAAAAVLVLIASGMLRNEPAWREVATDAARRAVIRLQDGTRVTLAPKSRLRYPADYGAARRDVQLDGQAHFEVAPRGGPPFRVHTRGTVAEDLGTAFVVRAYADQRATEVVVTDGRVALWRADTVPPPGARPAPYRIGTGPALVLAAGELGRLGPNGAATIQRGVDVERYVSWTRGVLVFNGAPLGEVVLTLERWYNVEIHLGDSALAARLLTATFREEPIDMVLERIALTLGLRAERSGGSALLLPKSR
jgi:ferric-dicitrate binding protein FerR (iron transport regulator)